jgi:integrase
MDEFDAELMTFVDNGVLDKTKLIASATEQNRKLENLKRSGSLERAWRPFHDSFDSDVDNVTSSIMEGMKASIDVVSLSNLDAAVTWPVLLALSTGMRRGEVLAVRWKNVDLECGTLRVMESLEQTKAGIRFKVPKSGRHRAITLPAYAIEELRRLKRQQAEALLALGIRQTGDTLLCSRADGEAHQPLSLTYEFARFMGRIKDLPRVRFHDLRHSHATPLLASGVHPKIASERLGHASVGITLDLYSHVTETMQNEAAVRLDSAMQVAKGRLGGDRE